MAMRGLSSVRHQRRPRLHTPGVPALVQSTLHPAASYLRRSTDRQEQSLGDQRREIAAWAARSGYEIVAEYVDDAKSGTSTKGRTAFQRMIRDAERGTFRAVVVWASDRFSRADLTTTEHFRYLLREAGVSLLSVTEDFLSRDGLEGDILRTIRQSQNRQYSISLSQNTLRGQLSAVLDSSDPGRMPPYGYDREVYRPDGTVLYRLRFLEGGDRQQLDRHGAVIALYARGQSLSKPSSDCKARLVLSEPSRVAVVRDIFRMCAEGVGFKGVADVLNGRGVLSPRGGLWQHTTVKAILKNRAYMSDLVWNTRSEGKFYRVAKGRVDTLKPSRPEVRVKAVEQEDWIVIEGAVPAIVDRETWTRAQAAAAARSQAKGGHGKQSNRWLLSGVTRCACCHQPYWGLRKRKGGGKSTTSKAYYICAGRCKHGKSVCPVSVHVPADALEAWVVEQVAARVFQDRETMEEAVERFVTGARDRCLGVDTAPMEREARQIEDRIGSLIAGLDPANISLVNDQLTAMRKRKEALLAQVNASRREALDEKSLRAWATQRLELLRELAKGRRDEKTRQVIASYVREIVIDPRTKSGVLVLAGDKDHADPDENDPPEGASRQRGSRGPLDPRNAVSAPKRAHVATGIQNANDPSLGEDGSQVDEVVGA